MEAQGKNIVLEDITKENQSTMSEKKVSPKHPKTEDSNGSASQRSVPRQPLHRGQNTAVGSARASAPQHIRIPQNVKRAGGSNARGQRPSSPTDTMLSPVSQKINKRRKIMPPKEPPGKTLQLDSEDATQGSNEASHSIVLCTPSPDRRSILGQMGYSFTSISDSTGGNDSIASNPVSFTLNVAHEKINSVMHKIQQPSVLIATHQVANTKASSGTASNVPPRQAFARRSADDDKKIRVRRSESAKNQVRDNPSDEEEAKEMLKCHSNSTTEVLSAVVVVDTKTGKRWEALDIAWIHFEEIPETKIEKIVSYTQEDTNWREILLSSPGALCPEHPKLATYIRKIEGVREALNGLPWESTAALLRMVGSPSPVASPKASIKASVAVSVAAHDAHGQQGGSSSLDE